MNVGDIVTHKDNSKFKKGRVVSMQLHLGTVLVRWENAKSTDTLKYHIPHHLKTI